MTTEGESPVKRHATLVLNVAVLAIAIAMTLVAIEDGNRLAITGWFAATILQAVALHADYRAHEKETR